MLEHVIKLVAGNVSVFVDVVDLKGEFELFVLFALDAEVGKSFDELIEVNFTVVVLFPIPFLLLFLVLFFTLL